MQKDISCLKNLSTHVRFMVNFIAGTGSLYDFTELDDESRTFAPRSERDKTNITNVRLQADLCAPKSLTIINGRAGKGCVMRSSRFINRNGKSTIYYFNVENATIDPVGDLTVFYTSEVTQRNITSLAELKTKFGLNHSELVQVLKK